MTDNAFKSLKILKDFSLHQTAHSIFRLNTSGVSSVRPSPVNSRTGHQYWEFIQVCQTYLAGETEGKRPLERPTCNWKDNIEINLRERR